jgi:hypothetical protein
MRRISNGTTVTAAALSLFLVGAAEAAGPPSGPLKRCPADAVVAGVGCLDKYEASVWRVPNARTVNLPLVRKIQSGTARVEDLTRAGARLLGSERDDYAPCDDGGQSCTDDIYAVSVPGVTPSAFITWFQAQQACTNSGKRLPSNAEWQAAVAGTPDPGPDDGVKDCNTFSAFTVLPTGSRAGCVSARGAFDMVGNLWEWVADWVPRSATCGRWSANVSPTDDSQCLAGTDETGGPGALLRGGDFGVFNVPGEAGPLAVFGFVEPSAVAFSVVFGFRCTR